MPPPRPTLLQRHGRLMARGRGSSIRSSSPSSWGPRCSAAASARSPPRSSPARFGGRADHLVHPASRMDARHRRAAGIPQRRLTVDDPGYRRRGEAALARRGAVVPGTRVVSYFGTGSRDMVGEDGHLTFATLSLPLDDEAGTGRSTTSGRHRDARGLRQTLVGGEAAVGHDTRTARPRPGARRDIVLPVALLILLSFFGSAPRVLPLAMAGVTIAARDGRDVPLRPGDRDRRAGDQRDHPGRRRPRRGLLAAGGLALRQELAAGPTASRPPPAPSRRRAAPCCCPASPWRSGSRCCGAARAFMRSMGIGGMLSRSAPC